MVALGHPSGVATGLSPLTTGHSRLGVSWEGLTQPCPLLAPGAEVLSSGFGQTLCKRAHEVSNSGFSGLQRPGRGKGVCSDLGVSCIRVTLVVTEFRTQGDRSLEQEHSRGNSGPLGHMLAFRAQGSTPELAVGVPSISPFCR